MNIEEIIEARNARRDLWAAACSGQITTAQLYARLRDLKARYGDVIYARLSR